MSHYRWHNIMKGKQTVSEHLQPETGGKKSILQSRERLFFGEGICRERTQGTQKKFPPALRSLRSLAAMLCFFLVAPAWAAPRQALPGHLPAVVKNSQPLGRPMARRSRLELGSLPRGWEFFTTAGK